jgi:hypothetical protein
MLRFLIHMDVSFVQAEVPKWRCLSPTWETEESNYKWGRREGPGRKNGLAWWGGGGGMSEERETWSSMWWGKRTEALRVSRRNVSRQPQEIGSWGTPQNVPETWEVRDSQDSEGGTLDETPNSRKRELIVPTSSRKTGHQWGMGFSSHSHISHP